jgi:hypothetical protein
MCSVCVHVYNVRVGCACALPASSVCTHLLYVSDHRRLRVPDLPPRQTAVRQRTIIMRWCVPASAEQCALYASQCALPLTPCARIDAAPAAVALRRRNGIHRQWRIPHATSGYLSPALRLCLAGSGEWCHAGAGSTGWWRLAVVPPERNHWRNHTCFVHCDRRGHQCAV